MSTQAPFLLSLNLPSKKLGVCQSVWTHRWVYFLAISEGFRPPLASNLDESSIGTPLDLTVAGNEFSAIVINSLIFLTVA